MKKVSSIFYTTNNKSTTHLRVEDVPSMRREPEQKSNKIEIEMTQLRPPLLLAPVTPSAKKNDTNLIFCKDATRHKNLSGLCNGGLNEKLCKKPKQTFSENGWKIYDPREEDCIDLLDAFKSFDKDDSGYISKDEFIYVIINTHDDVRDADIIEMYTELDKHDNSEINYLDFYRLYVYI